MQIWTILNQIKTIQMQIRNIRTIWSIRTQIRAIRVPI